MHETDDDIRALDDLIERSMEEAGSHLRHVFLPPANTLTARQVIRYFTGKKQVALATVTARGEPRVAPVDALLLRGRFCFGTSVEAARIRHLRARPAVSLAHYEGDELAIIVHGSATLVEFHDPEFRAIDEAFVGVYGGTPSTEDEGSIYGRVEPSAMYTFARDAERLPE